jgi:hypothetical protein
MNFENRFTGLLILMSLSFIFCACTNDELPVVEYLNISTDKKSAEPSLHLSEKGVIYLSWIESDSLSSDLKFTKFEEDSWLESSVIASGSNWFINWADFPALTTFGDNLAAHYLEKSADGTYTYDVKLIISNDDGKTWQKAFTPHTDNTNSEHGFVSNVALNETNIFNVWLDGRQYAYAEQDSTILKEMTLRGATINASSESLEEYLLDARVCDCCQTDTAMTNDGPIVVYRDRSDNEIRDIYYTRLISNEWTEPKSVFSDNWEIAGCPVNGPAIATLDNSVAVAWFTMADELSKVKIAFSKNNGATFENPIQTDFINPLGRMDVELIDANTALVCWMDQIGEDTVIQLQKIGVDGSKSAAFTLSKSSVSRSSGFPRIVIKNNYVYATWTDVNDQSSKIKTARVLLNNIK